MIHTYQPEAFSFSSELCSGYLFHVLCTLYLQVKTQKIKLKQEQRIQNKQASIIIGLVSLTLVGSLNINLKKYIKQLKNDKKINNTL